MDVIASDSVSKAGPSSTLFAAFLPPFFHPQITKKLNY
jgi:hypothetical protein